MPPKKTKKKEEEAEEPKKKPRKKKPAPAPVEKSKPEPVRSVPSSPPTPSARSSKKDSSSSGLFLFVVLVAIASVVGVYVFQQRQTDSVSSKISELEGKLQDKIGEIEEGIDKAKEQAEQVAEEAKEETLKKATTKTYTHAEHGYTLDYPTEYVISYISAGNDSHSGLTRFMREVDKVKYESLPEVGPRISFVVYDKPEDMELIDWLIENSLYTGVDEETEFVQVEVGEMSGYDYELPGSGTIRTVALDAGDYFFLAIAASVPGDDDVDLFEDFDTLLETLTF